MNENIEVECENETVQNEKARITSEGESVCRWAAARAGAIAMIPFAGTVGLIANEIYMIVRLGKIYGETIESSVAKGFLLSMSATLIGQTLANLVYIPGVNIAVAATVTYGIGKAAQAWIADGMPATLNKYRKICVEMKEQAKSFVGDLNDDPRKEQPLNEEIQ